MGKTLLLMRGLPGSGKSTQVAKIRKKCQEIGLHLRKCSADDYFIDEHGRYNFDRNKLGKAHGYSKRSAEDAMSQGVPLVIIDNTNTMEKEMNPYIKMAKKYGYRVVKQVVGNFDEESIKLYAKRNVHGVPIEAINRMAGRFQK